MKKTLRILVTEKCNFTCPYCCNKLPEVRDKFQYKTFEEAEALIESKQYDAVCLTGGEPLLKRYLTMSLLSDCRLVDIPCYLYTNGVLMSNGDMFFYRKFAGINIGLHLPFQLEFIMSKFDLQKLDNVRFYVEDIYKDNKDIEEDLHKKLIKYWHRNECFNNVESEDWLVLIKPSR